MGIEGVHTAAGALVAGFVTSVHCAGMCGPMACGLASLRDSDSRRESAAALYHAGRLVAYGGIGALAGATGSEPLSVLSGSPAVVLPWFLVFLFLFIGLGIHVTIPAPAFWKRWTARARLRLCRVSARKGAFMVGLGTPLLPCGPLYAMFGIALLSGSAVRGTEFMLAFGLGTIPLLWLAQSQFHRFGHRLSPAGLMRLRRGVALGAAAVMVWRLRGTLPFVDEAAAGAGCCPF